MAKSILTQNPPFAQTQNEIMHWDEFSEEEREFIARPPKYPNEKEEIQQNVMPHLQRQMRLFCARWQWLNNNTETEGSKNNV